jgi:hypothetical protein
MITLKRNYEQSKTTGILTLPNGAEVETLERPWLDNQIGISCIPSGIYKFKRDHYGKHQWFSVLDVSNRTFIEIHPGSQVSHSEGCILMSKKDCVHMLKWFGGDEAFVLEII